MILTALFVTAVLQTPPPPTRVRKEGKKATTVRIVATRPMIDPYEPATQVSLPFNGVAWEPVR